MIHYVIAVMDSTASKSIFRTITYDSKYFEILFHQNGIQTKYYINKK